MSRRVARECFVSVDVETSGPVVGRHSLLQLGACVVGRERESFCVDVAPIGRAHVVAAMKVIGRSMSEFQESGLPPRRAMSRFVRWVERACRHATPVFVGFNATFDWSFVNWYLLSFHGRNPFGIGGVDIKSYFMGAVACSWDATRSSQLPRAITGEAEGTHDALSDAVLQARMFERMLRLRGRRKSSARRAGRRVP